MCSEKNIRIDDYDYVLPEEKIALYPLPKRDASKLLVYKNGEISETVFQHISEEIPSDALLIFNDTKVIHARIVTHTPTGARIEIFCLAPLHPIDVQLAFQQKNRCVWKCFVGGNRKWKNDELSIDNCQLRIKRGKQIEDAWEVIFEWDSDLTFAEILESVGKIPLPPYIHREVEESDEERYQTIFAKIKGSVAAPTASLHFSDDVLKTLENRGIETTTLTLHVGAGTFKPVTTETIGNHTMHEEIVIVSKDCIEKIQKAKSENRPIIPVGTTSLRSVESLYWREVQHEQGNTSNHIEQWTPYLTTRHSALDAESPSEKDGACQTCNDGQEYVQFSTSLMIVPGYKFRIATGIITNFHQPKSTLLLLISALVGNDWRKIYDYALANNFRFLSYGDSCLLLP